MEANAEKAKAGVATTGLDKPKDFEDRVNICADDDDDNDDGTNNNNIETDDQLESILDPKNTDYNSGLVYPPNPKFLHSYNCWHQHQSVVWTSFENHPEADEGKFHQAEEKLQDIALQMIACLMFGDTVVLDTLACKEFNRITAVETLVMLDDQLARENVHQEVYSRMLDVSHKAAYYRSPEFYELRMQRFQHLVEEYTKANVDLRTMLYFIMVCENIMFAPMFQFICYLATTGYAPKLCDANLQVMRDEYIHYKHVRGLLAELKVKLRRPKARSILDAFGTAIIELLQEIIGDYVSADGMYSYDIALAHFRHVCHGFMRENGLYYTKEEERINEKLYGTSPAASYMYLPQHEIKINLMESNSTIYMVEGGDFDICMSDNEECTSKSENVKRAKIDSDSADLVSDRGVRSPTTDL